MESTQETTAIQKHEDGQLTIKGYLEDKKPAILDMLPRHVDGERYFKSAMLAVYRNPLLLKSTFASIYTSIVNAAELALDFTPAKRQAYLVPYFNNKKGQYEAQFMPGYGGLIDLALRTGKVKNIEAHIVYEKDTFVIEYGTTPKLTHIPYIDGNPGKVRGAYAIAFLLDGRTQSDYMRLDELEAIRKRSKAAEKGPWVTDTLEMYRKTPVRRLFKYLPSSPELDKALEYDNEVVGMEDMTMPTEPQTPYRAGSKTEDLLATLTGDAEFEDIPNDAPTKPPVAPENAPEPPQASKPATEEKAASEPSKRVQSGKAKTDVPSVPEQEDDLQKKLGF
jgi:recombination protein RecT